MPVSDDQGAARRAATDRLLRANTAVLGATGEGLTTADGLAMGGAAYAAGDNALQDVAPRKPPEHW